MHNLLHVYRRTVTSSISSRGVIGIRPYAIAECHDYGTRTSEECFERKDSNRLADMSMSKADAWLPAMTLSVLTYEAGHEEG